MEHQVINCAIVVKLWNQTKTLLAPVETLMYVSREMDRVMQTQ